MNEKRMENIAMSKEQLKKCYVELLEGEYKGQKIWELIRDKKLTGTNSFSGTQYEESKTRLMVVGRAMNGWEDEFNECTDAEMISEIILAQNFDFDIIVDRNGSPYEGRPDKKNYLFSNSNFFRLIKNVLEEYEESDDAGNRDNDWYDDTKNWHQKFVWSNLYKISPRESGNPEWKMLKSYMQNYIDILRIELDIYKPDRVLFITGTDYLEPWKRQPSFLKYFGFKSTGGDKNSSILGTANYNGIKMIVCKRPDRWGTSYADVKNMAKEIKDVFDPDEVNKND